MASDQQVALAGPRRASHQLNKTTRQVVPAFLQKLYEMVNDPSNAHLITWSETGDSFFVLDHERFAREVLGRWFKHQNFSSFVRQLNMYGFHKIPHLQQGVLRSETDTEYWNFAHASFQQGQPDLLVFIQRKKQAPQIGEEGMDVRDPSSTSGANLSSNQILDIHSIVNGIAAIKRHQTTISAELNELKRSNHLLWQDSMATRARHQKHQDTLNRIVKFLASVFGQNAASNHEEGGLDHTPTRAMVPRHAARFMIEGQRNRDAKRRVNVTEVEDEEGVTEPYSEPSSLPPSPDQIGTIETPQSVDAQSLPPSAPASPFITDMSAFATPTPQTIPNATISESSNGLLPAPNNTMAPQLQNSQPTFSDQPLASSALTPRTPPPGTPDFDHPRIQNILSQLSPGQMQQLLTSLASQTMPDSLPPPASDGIPMSSQLTSYQPPIDFSQFNNQPSLPHIPPPQLQSGEDIVPFDAPLLQDTDRLEKTWQATEDIDKDVNALQSSIASLVQTFNLDPNIMASPPPEEAENSAHDPSLLSDLHEPPGDSALSDFDFDSFLNSFPNNDNIDYGDMASTAFLDEVPSDGADSPIASLRQGSPGLQKVGGQKRKSDIAEREDDHRKSTNGTPPGAKSKRRKEK